MIIKMVNEFKLTVVHFARPNPMQICACAWIYRWTKKLWKIRTGLPGRRASGPRGRRGPLAAGHWTFGPPGRWAAGLLLAKPSPKAPMWEMVLSEQIYIQVNEGRGEKQKFLQINKSVDSKQ